MCGSYRVLDSNWTGCGVVIPSHGSEQEGLTGEDFEAASPAFMRGALDAEQYLRRRLYGGAIRNAVIVLPVMSIIWGALSFVLPDGWWHFVINVGAFLLTSGVAVFVILRDRKSVV